MSLRLPILAVTLTAALTGCGGYVDPGTVADADVSGKVVGPDGKAVTGLSIYFRPVVAGAQPIGFPLKADGSFSGKMKVGTYSYYLTPANENDRKGEALLSKLPDAYKKDDPNRTVEVKAGELQLKF